MARYRVRLVGRAFDKVVDGVRGPYDFVTNCFVDAITPQAAADRALALVSARPDLRPQLVEADPRASIVVEEIVQWAGEVVGEPLQGLVWYPAAS